MTRAALAVRTGPRLERDAARVITRLFVPGQELVGGNESRASGVVTRMMALSEAEVERELADVVRRFGGRHRELAATFAQHAERIANRIDADVELSGARSQLLGATFTHEYAIEAAALCNPSMVAHPDQRGTDAGELRFVMSVRSVGEGHTSSIGFRTGTISAAGIARVDPPAPFPVTGVVSHGTFDREVFRGRLGELGALGENAMYVLDDLAPVFTEHDLDGAIARLDAQHDTRRDAAGTVERLRSIAARSYETCFPGGPELSARVLWPATVAEERGVEDARFVRFVDDDGVASYYATYTAFDGSAISQQLLQTDDFASFVSAPLVGRAASNKGLALFPRRIDGRFAALSRHDRESNGVAFSDNPRRWDSASQFQVPAAPWESIQLGNCGSPIETAEGWLVLTHGVGPMRTYSLGAVLLDLDDPTRLVGHLAEPLLRPADDEQDGYVPNVVYSCGAMVHGSTLVVPYGIADSAIGIATVHLPDLLDVLTGRMHLG